MEEIRNSPIVNGKKRRVKKTAFFKYYLAINSYLKFNVDNVSNNTDFSPLEKAVARNAPQNEYQLSAYPIEDIYRNLSLTDYIINQTIFNTEFCSYMNSFSLSLTHLEYLRWMFKWVISISTNKNGRDIHILVPQNTKDKDLFKRFSDINTNLIFEKPLLEVFSVKKYPFHKINDESYLPLDTMFIVDKCYHSLVWDFFFDRLQIEKVRIDNFRSLLGGWFEQYIITQLKSLNPRPLPELIANGRELADLFIQNGNNMIIGQAKVSAMNSNDKYDENTIQSFFKNGKKEFYKEFGLKQMVDNTLKYLIEEPKNFNISISNDKEYVIYPMLIFNERILQTLGMNRIFQEKFLELVKAKYTNCKVVGDGEFPDIIIENIRVKPLILAYIGDIELISIQLNCVGTYSIWSLLESHIEKIRQNYNTQLLESICINRCYNNYLQKVIFPLMQ